MTVKLQVGSDIFEYPKQGSGNYGEEATAWAEAVTDALKTVQGPNDILLTSALLSNGSSGIISGLTFNTGQVQQITVEALIVRTYTDATPTESESININGTYNGSEFIITDIRSGDDTGVDIDVGNEFGLVGIPSGQFVYLAENKANTNTLTIKFKAKTIDQ